MPSSPTISPKLLSVTSSNSSTITLHFDRSVSAGDGNIVISDGYSQSYVGAAGLSSRIVGATDTRKLDDSDSQISYNGQDIVIHLSSPLKSGVGYRITMDAGAVDDTASGGTIDRIGSTKLFSFTASGSASVPATPGAVVAATIHFTDTGASNSDYVTASLDQVVSGSYTGTLGASDFIQVSLDNGASWHRATINSVSKTWSYEGEIDTGNLTAGAGGSLNGMLLARVSNTTGNSTATASHSYVYSNHPIEIDVNSTVSFSADTGVSNNDLITNTAVQTINGIYQGVLESGQTLQVSVDGGNSWINATASDGAWQAAGVTLLEGEHELQMRVADGAGNTSSIAYNEYNLISSGATLASRTLALAAGSDSGVSASDGITNNASAVTLNVAGLHGLHAGDTFEIVDTSNGSAVVGSYVIQYGDLYYGGDYLSVSSYNSTPRSTLNIDLDGPLSDGTHNLAVRLVDIAGNTGVASGSTVVKADTTAPQVSTTAPVDGAGSVSTSLTTLTFTFNDNIAIENGAQVTISDDNNPGNAQTVTLSSSDVNGKTLTIHLSSALTSGTSYTAQGAAISDLAGNVGITGDTPMLHFTTAGTYSGGSTPSTPQIQVPDSAPQYELNGSSPLYNDGITNDGTVYVDGLDSGATWYYRLSASSTWQQGSGSTFTLAEGSYAMDQIQVKQTLNGVDSAITAIDHDVVVDTTAPDALVVGTPESFSSGAGAISGALTNSSDLTNEIVMITFDHGASWVKASTTYVSSGVAKWSLSGISGQLTDNYGVLLSDLAGNVATLVNQGVSNPAYYLSNNGVIYSHGSDNDSTVFGGSGVDAITIGNHAIVVAGDGDTVNTGADAIVTVGDSATVSTGNGSNTVTAGSAAHITTGSGNDTITLDAVTGASVSAGAGADTLNLNLAADISLSALANFSGIDVINFDAAGGNQLTILGSAALHSFTDSDHLTVTATEPGALLHLDGSVWGAAGTQSGYNVYHNGQGSGSMTILVGQNITVDTLAGSA